jgi:hypothetical protein
VYDGPEGTIDLVPGPNTINCVAIVTGTRETFAGGTSITNAASDGVGYIRSAAPRAAMFVGVLPAGARELRAIDKSGREIPVPLTADDAYWITIVEPIDMLWTNADGSTHQTVFGRYALHRVILGDEVHARLLDAAVFRRQGPSRPFESGGSIMIDPRAEGWALIAPQDDQSVMLERETEDARDGVRDCDDLLWRDAS